MPMDQLDDEMSEIARDKGLHMDDDRDEILQIYIEDLVDNADWKDHGEYEGDADERAEESLEEAVEDTASMALEAAMAELKKLAGIEEQSLDTGVSSAEFTNFGKKRAEVNKLYGEEGLEMYSKIWDEVKRVRGPKATADEAFRVLVQKMAGKEKLGSKPLDMTGIG